MTLSCKKTSILISACLCGVNCRYDGSNRHIKWLDKIMEALHPVPICPEQVGGLPTPRSPSEIVRGDGFDIIRGETIVTNQKGENVTAFFLKGAYETLNLARELGIKIFLFKDKSPACGLVSVYRQNALARGMGVCSALLISNGLYGIPVSGYDIADSVIAKCKTKEKIYQNI